MLPERHLEIVRQEAALIAAVPADALDMSVPTVEEWTIEGVIRHVGKIHQWVTAILSLDPDQTMSDLGALPGMPKGPACLDAYVESADGLIHRFEQLDPEQPCTSFAGPATVGWWLRRQAQEVSVHRLDAYDGVHAAGGPAPAPLAADGAADGIDEWARFFLAVRYVQRFGAVPGDLHGRTVHIHGTDDPAPDDGAEWLLTFTPDSVEVKATHAKGDVALRGTSEDLLLALWRRRPLDRLEVIGDRSVAERLLDVARF